MGNKVDLQHLKAAMVLALESTAADPTVSWWEGVVKDTENRQCIVLQVAEEYTRKALKALKGYGISCKPIKGTFDLLPIPVDFLENCLTPRVTRKWGKTENLFPQENHEAFKREVTSRMDDVGIRRLKMIYSGSGDSANDDEWEASRTPVLWFPADWETGRHWHGQSSHEIPDDLITLISGYVWETLVQEDCVNNDGGGGSLAINATEDEPEFLFSCYTNETVTHTHNADEPI